MGFFPALGCPAKDRRLGVGGLAPFLQGVRRFACPFKPCLRDGWGCGRAGARPHCRASQTGTERSRSSAGGNLWDRDRPAGRLTNPTPDGNYGRRYLWLVRGLLVSNAALAVTISATGSI